MLTNNVIITKPLLEKKNVLLYCEQQIKASKSACASAQSDQHLCCSLSGKYNRYYNQNFSIVARF